MDAALRQAISIPEWLRSAWCFKHLALNLNECGLGAPSLHRDAAPAGMLSTMNLPVAVWQLPRTRLTAGDAEICGVADALEQLEPLLALRLGLGGDVWSVRLSWLLPSLISTDGFSGLGVGAPPQSCNLASPREKGNYPTNLRSCQDGCPSGCLPSPSAQPSSDGSLQDQTWC